MEATRLKRYLIGTHMSRSKDYGYPILGFIRNRGNGNVQKYLFAMPEKEDDGKI